MAKTISLIKLLIWFWNIFFNKPRSYLTLRCISVAFHFLNFFPKIMHPLFKNSLFQMSHIASFFSHCLKKLSKISPFLLYMVSERSSIWMDLQNYIGGSPSSGRIQDAGPLVISSSTVGYDCWARSYIFLNIF